MFHLPPSTFKGGSTPSQASFAIMGKKSKKTEKYLPIQKKRYICAIQH
jgi:hypothetical protein